MKKILLLLFLPLAVNAQTTLERVNTVIKSDVRAMMNKCEYSSTHPNKSLFIKNMTLGQLECLESYKDQIVAAESLREQRRLARKQALIRIKSANCSALSGFIKDLCITMK